MKTLTFFTFCGIILWLASSCQSKKTASSANKKTANPAAVKQASQVPTGIVSRKQLEAQPHQTWFNEQYDSYEPDRQMMDELAPLLEETDVVIFMGTWCGDSRREVPNFYAILDEADVTPKSLKIIALDTKKATPAGLEKGKNIERVPTFIFMKNGREIGRIVEQPVEKSGRRYAHHLER